MANFSLTRHPATPCVSVRGVSVELERRPARRIWLRYSVVATDVKLPPPASGERADGLWRTTCMELFARRPGDEAYVEFNFSPSSQWAAYRFPAYREGMTALSLDPPVIGLEGGEGYFAIEVEFAFPSALGDQPIEVALAAVVEEESGAKSCWALRHPAGAPDFHSGDCFALALPSPGQEGEERP